jgi:uncharacterized protein YjbI with pentapeptide repeats
LKRFSETGEIDARGLEISADLLGRILAAAPRAEGRKPMFKVAFFSGAIFSGDAGFGGAIFTGRAEFGRTTFTGRAGFSFVTFSGGAEFGGAAFASAALFARAIFSGGAEFGGATFASGAEFGGATFSSGVVFDKAMFSGDAGFNKATFSGDTWFSEATFTGPADFSEATFTGQAWFGQATTFTGNAWFSEARFLARAYFGGATFSSGAHFGDAIFTGAAWFARATFAGGAVFRGATFSGAAAFGEATFTGRAEFTGVTFSDDAAFDQVTFSSEAWFGDATISGNATFSWVTFSGDAGFRGVLFRRWAHFYSARFDHARKLGPILAHRGLDLDDTEFTHAVQIEASTTGLCCRRARFPGGVQFQLRWARVVLDDADIPAPSILTGIPQLTDRKLAEQEKRIARAWQRLLAGDISDRPQVLSLRRANVAGLGLSNAIMANCLFAGAHNLDEMRLEANVTFPLAHSPLGKLSWEGRQVIAEECAWRAARSRVRGWASLRWPGWADQPPAILDPGQIAGLYRALRKGREDIKDEPGAADFYYGEMEMRRRTRITGGSTARGRAERGLLTAYWLVSGYGLRAWRGLAWLAAICALFAVGFHAVGFSRPPQPVSYWTSLLYAFRATISLPDDNVQLTAWGKLLQALLRLTGPVLLGLALLALRGRVKR